MDFTFHNTDIKCSYTIFRIHAWNTSEGEHFTRNDSTTSMLKALEEQGVKEKIKVEENLLWSNYR